MDDTWPPYFMENFTDEERREAMEWADRQKGINRMGAGAYLIFKKAYADYPAEDLFKETTP